jgi:2-polyprenyl-3-methyl-5-hydroxy-6-metoxy-1,4-benzoquinol methylase
MSSEIKFNKYEKLGRDYHYKEVSKRYPTRYNPFVSARYINNVTIIKKALSQKTTPSKTLKIVDIGCGDGLLLYMLEKELKDYDIEVYGLDPVDEAITTCKEKMPKGKFKVGSAYETGYEDDFFDIVVSSDVIEHVQEPSTMLDEINRITKENGIILITTPIRFTEIPLDNMHVQEFFSDEFSQLVSNHLKIDRVYETHSLIWNLLHNKYYNVFGKKLPLFRIVTNLLGYIGLNPFIYREEKEDQYTYIAISASKK